MDIAIIFGSKTDLYLVEDLDKILKEFKLKYDIYVLSAHKAPEKLIELIKKLEREEVKVIISGAGLSAHLPGFIASFTDIPVIGIPIKKEIGGMDSLLSIVQMPKGVPVATVGIDNSYNAALLAIKILSINDEKMRKKLKKFKEEIKKKYFDQSIN